MKGREAQSQLGKTGAYEKTDLAAALLGFAISEKPSRAQNRPRELEFRGESARRHLAERRTVQVPTKISFD